MINVLVISEMTKIVCVRVGQGPQGAHHKGRQGPHHHQSLAPGFLKETSPPVSVIVTQRLAEYILKSRFCFTTNYDNVFCFLYTKYFSTVGTREHDEGGGGQGVVTVNI